jgi:hypothetical protein
MVTARPIGTLQQRLSTSNVPGWHGVEPPLRLDLSQSLASSIHQPLLFIEAHGLPLFDHDLSGSNGIWMKFLDGDPHPDIAHAYEHANRVFVICDRI